MKRTALLAVAILTVTGITASLIWGRTTKPAVTAAAKPAADWIVAGAGRVEPHSEDIKLGVETSGRLTHIYVDEGSTIVRGQVLAEIENAEYKAQVSAAEAEVKQKEAELRKVVNGARREERREALSTIAEARAVMENAQAEMARHQKLYDAGVVSREDADAYAKDYGVAKARYEATVERHRLIDEDAREEDRSMAAADLLSARAKLEQSQALLAKTYVRSPIDGTVLRRHHREGESVSNFTTSPDPLFTLGDKSSLRVRVDVDESDVSKLALGQRAYVTAETYGDRRFWGHVVRVGQEMGRKNIRTDEPTERVDTKILETLVQLDPGTDLPIGLRVTTFILPDTAHQKP
jgi:ABC exporter DevB family membrane fusion protein